MPLFIHSSLEILDIILDNEEKLDKLQEEIAEEHESVREWVQKYAELREARREEVAQDLKAELDEAYELLADKAEEHNQKIKEYEARIAYLSRPWWKKLFG